MVDGKGCKTDDRIHRCPDIMRHIGKENTLCLARAVRLHQGTFQYTFLFHLTPCFIIHTAKTKHRSAPLFPISGAHRLHLEISQFAITICPVIYITYILFSKFFRQPFPRTAFPQQFAVFLIHAVLYIPVHFFFQVKITHLCKYRLQHIVMALVDAQSIPCSSIEIKITYQIKIDAERLDKLHLTALIFPLLLFLFCTIEKEPLIKKFPIFLQQLDIPHNMKDFPVLMFYGILRTDTVALLLKCLHTAF